MPPPWIPGEPLRCSLGCKTSEHTRCEALAVGVTLFLLLLTLWGLFL